MDVQLELLYLDCRWSFGALLDFEADTISFLQAFEAGTLDGAMVNKDIFSAFSRDKSVTLLIVEPLYSTLRHNSSNPFILLVSTILNTRNINVKSRWRQEIKQKLPSVYGKNCGASPGNCPVTYFGKAASEVSMILSWFSQLRATYILRGSGRAGEGSK
jgi:hypothetical protein